jgi:hypothetical protein
VTSTVWPSFEFDAVFTITPDLVLDAAWLDAALLELEELPHAASASAAAADANGRFNEQRTA